jgi:hypothetical protein
MGFAIMFRMKISPQAVLTVQAALPRVVIALILVTFSYAIAGFLIDLMYVGITLIIALLSAGGLFTGSTAAELQNQFLSGGFPQVIGAAFKSGGDLLGYSLLGGILGAALGAFVGGPPGAWVGGLLVGGLIFLLLCLIVLYVVLKLFLELVKTYINIVLAVVLGPLQIMMGVLPGIGGFGGWFKNLLANVLVFPAVAAFLILSRVLMSSMTTGGDIWTPPMLGMPGLVANVVPVIIALGFLLMLHKVPEMVRAAFQIKPTPYGAAIGESLGPVVTPIRYVTGVGIELGTKGGFSYAASGVKESFARRFGKVSKETSSGEISSKDIPEG